MLSQILISQLRNIQALNIRPCPDINLLLGENGSGKTSILEAIHLLALGRSFRTRSLKNTIRFGEQQFQIIGKTEADIPVGIQFAHKAGLQIRLNSAPLKKLSELAAQLPLQYISANCHQFFEMGPRFRRNLVDWGVFHVEPSFNFHWQSYKKIVQQRNSAIKKNKSIEEITIWDKHMAEHGEAINTMRLKYLAELLIEFQKIFVKTCHAFRAAEFSLHYKSGWHKDHKLESALSRNMTRDRDLGYTRQGSHAADWSFKINELDPAEVLSRGQQKLFYLALSMAQGKLSKIKSRDRTILLIDDLSSELDVEHQELVLHELMRLPVQSFITTTETSLKDKVRANTDKVFHVKQGQIEDAETLTINEAI